MPALRALAAAYPEHRRVLAAPRALAPLIALIGPDPLRVPARSERTIDGIFDLPAWTGGADAPTIASAAALPGCPGLAVNLHGRGPESHRLLLATGPRRLLGFSHPDVPETAAGPAWDPDEHEVARWCRLLESYGIPADPTALDLPAPAPASGPAPPNGAAPPGPAPTLLHPGAASPARRWPAERWATVARAEREAGRPVVITGSVGEAGIAREIARRAELPEEAVFAGRTELRALAALVGSAGRVVCGDTGVAHLATAFRIPSVVLFGPTPPSRWGPSADRPWHRALWTGHRGDPHARRPDPGLLEIESRDVLAALADLPRARPLDVPAAA